MKTSTARKVCEIIRCASPVTSISVITEASDVAEIPGRGMTGMVAGKAVVVGTARETAMPRPDLDEIDGIWFVSREAFIEAIAFDDLRETIRRALEER